MFSADVGPPSRTQTQPAFLLAVSEGSTSSAGTATCSREIHHTPAKGITSTPDSIIRIDDRVESFIWPNLRSPHFSSKRCATPIFASVRGYCSGNFTSGSTMTSRSAFQRKSVWLKISVSTATRSFDGYKSFETQDLSRTFRSATGMLTAYVRVHHWAEFYTAVPFAGTLM